MDPDEALGTIRELCRTTESRAASLREEVPAKERVLVSVVAHLAEVVRGLDEWVTGGGFLPAPWQAGRGAERYYGWPNRETWAIHLHLANDEGLYAMTRDLVAGAEDLDGAESVLRTWILDLLVDELETTPQGRMMLREVGSLWRIDWHRIAAAFIED